MVNSNEILESIMMNSLNTFSYDLKRNWRFGKEREAVNIFALDYLLPNALSEGLIQKNSQIGIEIRVPQLNPSPPQKEEVCKDLVIWRQPFQNCWKEIGVSGNYPLAIIEWKDDGNGIDPVDIEWLKAYTSHTPTEIGYAITVDFRHRKFTVAAVKINKGSVGEIIKWGDAR